MSMRINLMMGYGLTNLECDDDGVITDPRINPVGYLGLKEVSIDDDVFTMSGFNKQVHKLLMQHVYGTRSIDVDDLFFHHNYCKTKANVSDCIVHDAEMGLPGVLCLIPPVQYDNWYRYDSTIDYYLSTANVFPMSNSESWVRSYDFNFYPYSSYIDTHTGEYITYPRANIVQELYRRTADTGIWTGDNVVFSTDWKEILDCSTSVEARARYVRAIPGCLKAFIQYTKLFTSDDVIFQLKPILYSYWS